MNKRELETILRDQREEMELKKKIRFVHRRKESEIDLESTQAQVVIGVRRCGKSTLCHNALIHSGLHFAYVNLDDERMLKLKGEDLNDILEVLYIIYGDFQYLFIDEIQNIPEWYLFVNRLLRRGMHVILTGSNAKLLSGELATHLSGRHNKITLYPFSFKEFCEYKEIDTRSISTRNIATLRESFDEYMHQGGFPEMLKLKNKKSYISNLVEDILIRDIKQRFKIRYASTFEQISNHLLNTVPCTVSDTRLQDQFAVKSLHTVKNYIYYLNEAFLLLTLRKYSAKSVVRLTGRKEYAVDVALMNNREDAFARENYGWRLETIIYLELLRRYKPLGYDIYYFSDRGAECDFVVCEGSRAKLAVQVSFDISDPKTRKREFKGLMSASKKTKAEKLLLITDTEEEELTVEGRKVEIVPAWRFLLTENAGVDVIKND